MRHYPPALPEHALGGRPLTSTRLLATVGRHAFLIGLCWIFIAPLLVVVLTGLMSNGQAVSGSWIPHPLEWSNFSRVFRIEPFWHYAWNTFELGLLTTIGSVASSIPVAYALSRLSWKGRQVAFLAVLATGILPLAVVILPSYILFAKIHWLGTLKPLVVPSFFGSAFSVFLMRQYFMAIPAELTDAARTEGCGEFAVLARVVVPLARPAIVTAALLNFVYVWNDFFVPLVYLGPSQNLWTVSLGLANLRTAHHSNWNLTMAAATMVMFPVLVVFVLAQRALMDSVALTGAPRG